MNLYNPFRSHVAQLRDGSFVKRRLTPVGWQFLDRDGDYWWSTYMDYYLRHCPQRSFDAAASLTYRAQSRDRNVGERVTTPRSSL